MKKIQEIFGELVNKGMKVSMTISGKESRGFNIKVFIVTNIDDLPG